MASTSTTTSSANGNGSGHANGHAANNGDGARTQTDIRLYGFRASYLLPASLSILRESPVIHVAFVHPGNGSDRDETVMNVPLIGVCMPDVDVEGEYEDGDERNWALYLHTHRQSGLVEAVQSGIRSLTATTTKIDGMIFSPTAHDHSLNYRSTTLHLHSPQLLNDDDPAHHEEKRAALAEVTNTVTGYERTRLVGEPNDPNVKRTTVIKCKVKAVSCKQRYGAFSGGKEPVFDAPEGKEGDAFTGVVPCWTQWGGPLGYGRDKDEVVAHFEKRSKEAKAFADGTAWGSEAVSLEGLGKKRRPRVDDE